MEVIDAIEASIDIDFKFSVGPIFRQIYCSYYLLFFFIIFISSLIFNVLLLKLFFVDNSRFIIPIFNSIKRIDLNFFELSAFEHQGFLSQFFLLSPQFSLLNFIDFLTALTV
jgi:hypothetical protein